jgi:hypothetical protein
MRRERRKNFRVEWNSGATIYHDKLARPCILVDLSNGGARITGIMPDTIPDEFTLRFTRGRCGTYACRVLWRSDDAVGVAFTDRMTSTDELNLAGPARERERTP